MPAIEHAPAPPAQTLFAPLAPWTHWLLAVSGGPDSMALLLLAQEYARQRQDQRQAAVRLHVATVDHGLRPQARAEAEAVHAVCARFGLPHEILTWTEEKPETRVQERARAARYQLLAAHAKAVGCQVIVTGHHADDQAETVLMRLARGSGPAGLAGMAMIAPTPFAPDLPLARPLLSCPKAALIACCKARGEDYFDDPMNLSSHSARGRWRAQNQALTHLGLDRAALTRLAARARRAEEALAALTERRLAELTRAEHGASVSYKRSEVADLPLELLIRLLSKEIAGFGGAPRLERLERAANAIAAAGATGEGVIATLAGVKMSLKGAFFILAPAPPHRSAQDMRAGPSQ